ncbi:hypothetical protein [Janthinobacterium violaceinigrum]|uniref:Uncharacterized protein n=1 Tax=Janthinobacterium violaceinigrum TaxID=2654252 RepID=A0A6I1I5V1_9BURK|nr:hypothetical protein [Janthinobacterium violaceinigrum]KAB8066275.1 hypothetical protein GCN75_03520 [Janthinobacterium violaceinigrum]
MAYGILLKKESGAVLVSSVSFGIVFVDLISVAPNASTSKSYPAFVGRTFKTLSGALAVISYPGGIPTVSVDASEFAETKKIYIFSL